jgi:NAD(P)-dependent dehydrogenase (short-subunit alcohol dehydrogenase family)
MLAAAILSLILLQQIWALQQTPLRVVVAGATGRMGRLVCEQLLQLDPDRMIYVTAVIRDTKKAREILGPLREMENDLKRLEIVKLDLSDLNAVKKLTKECDKLIWCATGFTDRSSNIDKILGLLRLKFNSKSTIDIATIKTLGDAFAKKKEDDSESFHLGPQIIMCSSAGVSRPVRRSILYDPYSIILTYSVILTLIISRPGQLKRRRNTPVQRISQSYD